MNNNDIVQALMGAVFFLIVFAAFKPEWRAKINIKTPSLGGFGNSLFWKKLVAWVAIEGLAVGIISRFWHISGDTLWAWTKEWFLIVIPLHILIGFVVFRKSSGHGGSIGEMAKSVGSLAMFAGGLFLCIQIGGCLGRMNNPDFAPPSQATVTPIPQIDPNTIRMGTWKIAATPDQYTEWVVYYPGRSTAWKVVDRQSTVILQKGKLVGDKVVPSDSPPQKVRPTDIVWTTPGEAGRFSGYTNTSTIEVTRGWP